MGLVGFSSLQCSNHWGVWKYYPFLRPAGSVFAFISLSKIQYSNLFTWWMGGEAPNWPWARHLPLMPSEPATAGLEPDASQERVWGMGDGKIARGEETERGKQKWRGVRPSAEESTTEGAEACREGRSPRTRGVAARGGGPVRATFLGGTSLFPGEDTSPQTRWLQKGRSQTARVRRKTRLAGSGGGHRRPGFLLIILHVSPRPHRPSAVYLVQRFHPDPAGITFSHLGYGPVMNSSVYEKLSL